jgi:hypothetical protein
LEVIVIIVLGEHGAEACGGRRSAVDSSAVERKTLAIFTQFHLQSLDLTAEKTVLVVGCV